MGRGTVAAGDGGGAATSRHSPSVSPPGCHLPMASPQGGLRPLPVESRHPAAPQRHDPQNKKARLPAKAGLLRAGARGQPAICSARSEEHTSELQSLMRISYAVFCLKKKKQKTPEYQQDHTTH